jgi:hypothetical protein
MNFVRNAIARTAVTALATLTLPALAFAQGDWNKLDVIKSGALQIRATQLSQGNVKAQADVDECYARVMRPSIGYSRDVENCITKDFALTLLLAAGYEKSGQKDQANALDTAMRRRVSGVFLFFGIPQDQAGSFVAMLRDNAMQAIAQNEKK